MLHVSQCVRNLSIDILFDHNPQEYPVKQETLLKKRTCSRKVSVNFKNRFVKRSHK